MGAQGGLLDKDQRSRLATCLGTYRHIVAAYQYGSTARDKAGPSSDLDIALLLDEATAPSGAKLAYEEGYLAHEIRRSLDGGSREVDVVSLNGRSVAFQHTVLRTGRVVYDRAPETRRRYEWRILMAYLDFEPTLRWMRQFQAQGWLRRSGVR